MDAMKRMLIEHECARLIVDYAHKIDHLDVDGFVNLFTKDAVYKQASQDKPWIGHDQIRTWVKNYPRDQTVRHVASNIKIDVIDENSAKASSYTTVYKSLNHKGAEPSPRTTPRCVVEYLDDFVRQPEGWKIKSRRYTYQFFNAD